MLKLFRGIRQKLIASGDLKRYFFYAVGEIILVVIGILIALQVNNWDQTQQERKMEKEILLEIENNLKQDSVDVADEIESFKVVVETTSILVDHFHSEHQFNDSIGALIHVSQMSPHLTTGKNGYKLLESKGIELISDNALRIGITDLYERHYPYYNTYAKERFDMIEALIQPYWAEHFYLENHDEWPFSKRVPMDYESLLKEEKFVSLLQTSLFQARVMTKKSTSLQNDIELLRGNIRRYLKQYER